RAHRGRSREPCARRVSPARFRPSPSCPPWAGPRLPARADPARLLTAPAGGRSGITAIPHCSILAKLATCRTNPNHPAPPPAPSAPARGRVTGNPEDDLGVRLSHAAGDPGPHLGTGSTGRADRRGVLPEQAGDLPAPGRAAPGGPGHGPGCRHLGRYRARQEAL